MNRRAVRGGLIVVSEVVLCLIAVAAVFVAGRSDPLDVQTWTKPVPAWCEGGASEPFIPSAIDLPGVADDLLVVPLPRDDRGVPGVPNVEKTYTVAFDAPGPRPGASKGLVRLNTHTWPNGAALGNAMLEKFHVGDILVLRGGGRHLCYRVNERVEVDADHQYYRYHELDGRPEFTFIVCSGERRGPNDWTKRTLWWGTPL